MMTLKYLKCVFENPFVSLQTEIHIFQCTKMRNKNVQLFCWTNIWNFPTANQKYSKVVKLFGLDHENLNSKPRSWLVDNCLCKHHLIVNDFTYKSHDFSQSNILLFLCVLCYYIEIISNLSIKVSKCVYHFIHFILPYPIIIEITTC